MSHSPSDGVLAIEKLLVLINPDSETAQLQCEAFHDALTESRDEDAEYDEYDAEGGSEIMWILKDIIDHESGYFVDWKDTEAFISAIDNLAESWDAEVDWGVDDPYDDEFLDETDVPSLMKTAHASLLEHGFTLWNWNTDGDCYGGWIARSKDDAKIFALAERLEVQFRTGEHPF